ncbi:MAG: response regulator [Ruminococcus sp.]
MTILAADDEILALEWLEKEIAKAVPDALVAGFLRASEALEFAEKNMCDVAFLDIEMNQENGIELAKNLKKIQPEINIIFTTAFEDYMGDAWRVHASGYVLKPVTAVRIKQEMKELRYREKKVIKKLKVQCFGNFEVFTDGVPLKFGRSKTKEMFAYLIDRRGAALNTNQLCAVLWENKEDSQSVKSLFRTLVQDLRQTLKTADAEEVFVTSRNSFAINPDLIDCDYYRYCNGEKSSEIKFNGEYMLQYSWAEYRNYSMN